MDGMKVSVFDGSVVVSLISEDILLGGGKGDITLLGIINISDDIGRYVGQDLIGSGKFVKNFFRLVGVSGGVFIEVFVLYPLLSLD